MTGRLLNNRARGKHIGHACEGHLRGLLHHIAPALGCSVSRELPFEFPVESDAILVDGAGRVRAIFIVAFWDNARNSDSKFYRTRTEYREAWETRRSLPKHFAPKMQVFTVLYGTKDGWKPQVLKDLDEQCPPLLFLPSIVPPNDLQELIESSFLEYVQRWQAGYRDAREVIEKTVAARSLTAPESRIASKIRRALDGASANATNVNPAFRARGEIRVPAAPVRTRYRQALSVLSVFAPGEAEQWHRSQAISCPLTESFARRAHFLGLGTLSNSRTIAKRCVTHLSLRQPYGPDGRYEAHRPDFAGWLSLDGRDLTWILSAHRERTRNPTSVFRGGTADQVIGNVGDIVNELTTRGPEIIRCAKAADVAGLAMLLMEATAIGPVPQHPAAGFSQYFPAWSGIVCALAVAENDRALRGKLRSRRAERPLRAEARDAARRFVGSASARKLFQELVDYCHAFRSTSLMQLADIETPALLRLDEPCSILADFYNTLTTNPSHNPLNEVLAKWLSLQFSGAAWSGWPGKRGISPSAAADGGRRQWTFVMRDGMELVCAEVKSVTANHWGDKSKELFDRVAELRAATSSVGLTARTILMFDGDLSSGDLAELRKGIAHDEVWSVDDVLTEIGR